jgi:hypothetical protein
VILELVGVGAWMGGRAAVRAARGMPAGAAQGARTGWATGRTRAQDRRHTRRDPTGSGRPTPPGPTTGTTSTTTSSRPGSGEQIVDAEILCGRPGCDTVLAPDDPGPLCPACRTPQPATATTGDDVQVSVQVTPAAAAESSQTVPMGTRRPDGLPEIDRDRRFFDRRQAGYLGPIDQDDYPVASMALGARRLSPQEVAEAIAAGGYPPDGQPWGPSSQVSCEDGSGEVGDTGPVGRQVCTWLDRDGQFCGADLPPGELFCAHHATDDDPGDGGVGAARGLSEGEQDGAWEQFLRRPFLPPATSETSGGHPAVGQHDHDHDDQEDKSMTTSTATSAATGAGTTDMTITSRSGGTNVHGRTRMGGELTAVGDLRAEITELRQWAEVSRQMLQDLETWAAGLPEQVAAADWSTEAVTQAAVGLAEARTVEEVRTGITGLLAAAAEAERLGEQLAVGGARKGVAGLRPQ